MNKLYYTIQAMKKYGGSFVNALAVCMETADIENLAKIKKTWPEYLEKYAELGKELPRNE